MKTLLLSAFFGLAMLAQAAPIELVDAKGRKITVEVISADKDTVIVTKGDQEEIKIPVKTLSDESKVAVSREIERQQAAIEAAKPKGIVVTSLVIKRIKASMFGDTFRYFFDIRNHGPEPFTGSVEITLQNAMKGLTNGTAMFATTQPMQVEIGSVQFADCNIGPREFHGDWCVAGYTWKVLIDGKQIAHGRGVITDQVDDLTQR